MADRDVVARSVVLHSLHWLSICSLFWSVSVAV